MKTGIFALFFSIIKRRFRRLNIKTPPLTSKSIGFTESDVYLAFIPPLHRKHTVSTSSIYIIPTCRVSEIGFEIDMCYDLSLPRNFPV